MDTRLKQDINHLFSVFQDNTLMDLHQLLPPASEVVHYQAKLKEELKDFRCALLRRLEREFR